MNWLQVTFEPLDVLTASDARTLETGGSAHAGALAPGAFAGLLRRQILVQAGFGFPMKPEDVPRETAAAQAAAMLVGHPPFHSVDGSILQIAAPFLRSDSGIPFLPLPRFTAWDGSSPDSKEQLSPSPTPVLTDERLMGLRLLSGEQDWEPDPRWVDLETLCCLLGQGAADEAAEWQAAGLKAGNYSLITRFRKPERHWGHQRTDSGVPADRTLWSRPVERFCARVEAGGLCGGVYLGLVRGAAVLEATEPFVARLGGDGHLVRVTCSPTGEEYDAVQRLGALVLGTLGTLRGLILYLATPAVFEDGWRPLVGAREGLRLVAAAIGRPLPIGGWDLANRKPKAVVRATPAGSTFFFAVDDFVKATEFVSRHHWNDSLSLPGTAREGFGLTLCGVWDAREFVNGGS